MVMMSCVSNFHMGDTSQEHQISYLSLLFLSVIPCKFQLVNFIGTKVILMFFPFRRQSVKRRRTAEKTNYIWFFVISVFWCLSREKCQDNLETEYWTCLFFLFVCVCKCVAKRLLMKRRSKQICRVVHRSELTLLARRFLEARERSSMSSLSSPAIKREGFGEA